MTSATKSNGISITMPYWDERVEAMAAGYPELKVDKYHIDILTAHFVLHPDWFDVVVASNLFGDILSDLGPACTGTIGVAPSANINPERTFPSLFEPVHGSAPDIAGRGIANPIGQIWCGAMMLEHLGHAEAGAAVLQAIESVLATGPQHAPLTRHRRHGGNRRSGPRDRGGAVSGAAGTVAGTVPDPRALLLESFQAAVAAADPLQVVAAHLPPPHAGGRTGGGRRQGRGFDGACGGACLRGTRAALEGLVVTRYAHGLPTRHIRVIEAGHPVPDEAGEQAAAEILARVQALGPDDRLVVLVSGGGSSLLSLPADGIAMADLKATTRELLRAPITDMNIVRKHLSRIQGGRLAQASRAPVTTLIVSDVAGDDPSAIASGPTVADPSTFGDALAILRRYGATVPAAVLQHLERGARGELAETPKPGDAVFARVDNRMIATAHGSLEAAAARSARTASSRSCWAIR